jgi:hypothetical protein
MRIRHIAVTSALGVATLGVAFGALSIPAGADVTAGVSGFSASVTAGPAAAAVVPTTHIEPGKPRTWNPTSLSAAPVAVGSTCSSTNVSFIIDNVSAAKATITFGPTHTLVGTLSAKKEGGVCVTGPAGAKGVFHITGSTSKLTVTLT